MPVDEAIPFLLNHISSSRDPTRSVFLVTEGPQSLAPLMGTQPPRVSGLEKPFILLQEDESGVKVPQESVGQLTPSRRHQQWVDYSCLCSQLCARALGLVVSSFVSAGPALRPRASLALRTYGSSGCTPTPHHNLSGEFVVCTHVLRRPWHTGQEAPSLHSHPFAIPPRL